MNISAALLALVVHFEGFSETAYQDVVNVWTIGYGHTHNVQPHDTITKQTARNLLSQELVEFRGEVIQHANKCGYEFNENQIDALTSFTFNLGYGNLRQLTAKCTRSIDTIGEKIMLYNKAGGKAYKGLTRRRAQEQALYES